MCGTKAEGEAGRCFCCRMRGCNTVAEGSLGTARWSRWDARQASAGWFLWRGSDRRSVRRVFVRLQTLNMIYKRHAPVIRTRPRLCSLTDMAHLSRRLLFIRRADVSNLFSGIPPLPLFHTFVAPQLCRSISRPAASAIRCIISQAVSTSPWGRFRH